MSNQKRSPVDGNPNPRKKRVPVSGNRDILYVHDKDPEYEYRIVNDDPSRPGRVQKFLDAWWEVAPDAEISGSTVDDPVSRGVDSIKSKVVGYDRELGRPIIGVLMRIKKELYEEDQKAKRKAIDEKEAAMKRETKKPGFYGKYSND